MSTIRSDTALSELDESGLLGQPHTLVDADNATLLLRSPDGTERRCTDFISAYASVNFGHRNPALSAALDHGSDLAALFYPEEAEAVAAWLRDAVGRGERKVLFQVGGSFAVSTAFALARRRRPGKIVSIAGAFHGLGVDALAATTVQRDMALQETGWSALLADQITAIPVGAFPDDWNEVSALIYEPVQGANGYVPLPADWLAALESQARAAGVTTIADEIQCGFFRHGSLSPSLALGLDPDIVLFGKSLTNGMYPLSAVVYRRQLVAENMPAQVRLAHTFQTGTLGYRAALRVSEFLDTAPVPELSDTMAKLFHERAAGWTDRGLIRDPHVTGPALSFEPVAVTSRSVMRDAFRDGVLVISGGARGGRIRVAPPLTTPVDQIVAGLDVIGEALASPGD